MSRMRGAAKLTGFFLLTLPLMPVQAALLRFAPKAARHLPHWYHKRVCRILGVNVHVEGALAPGRPVLLVSNHTTWLDIPVLSAAAPVSFVAKKEVSFWPFVSRLAKLQRSVFVDRTRRQAAGAAANEMTERLASGDALVLFAEGTSSDGNRVLPFRTALFAAAGTDDANGDATSAVAIQTAAVVYTHVCGIPLDRATRPRISWYGDMEMQSHAWQLLQLGPIGVTVKIGQPAALADFDGRKDMALKSEREVRTAVHGILRGLKAGETLRPVEPTGEHRANLAGPKAAGSQKWT